MTLYSVLVAKIPLQTIDCTGIAEVTVREMKKMYPITESTSAQPWHLMDDDARILHAPDESAFGQLNIFEWNNPPYDLEFYNEKPFVYGIEGNWGPQFLEDLLIYLKEHIIPEQSAELIRFWAEDYDRKLKSRRIIINDIELHHLESLKNEEYIRIVFV
ncbi:hypothetical protein [Lysinibacillus cavernae]|uniref:hypothetical protein n=1 Tax=Lysinibacillus cavernae TaxID=2666135 RepID=UPI0012D8CC7F|nr:hypothetical protein [Lysinibacillus cavernae]